jgi:hypothetical protein
VLALLGAVIFGRPGAGVDLGSISRAKGCLVLGVVPNVVTGGPVPVAAGVSAIAGTHLNALPGTQLEAAELVHVTRRITKRPPSQRPRLAAGVLDGDVFRIQAGIVTVPTTARVAEFGRRLDGSIRRAGFAPLRLDLSQDLAFAASTIPLGVSLTRSGDA